MINKKIISFLLCCLLVVTSINPTAFASENLKETEISSEDVTENSTLVTLSEDITTEEISQESTSAEETQEINIETSEYTEPTLELNAENQVEFISESETEPETSTVINNSYEETSTITDSDVAETSTTEETTVETLEESSELLETTVEETTSTAEPTLETTTLIEETILDTEETIEPTEVSEEYQETTTVEETLPILEQANEEATVEPIVEETNEVIESVTEESIIIEQELVNKNISVKGVLPKNTELSVTPINNRKKSVSNIYKSVSNVYKYDITLINDGKEIQPEDTITLIFSFDKLDPNLIPHVYHTHNDKTEELKYQIEDNNIIVEVDSFSIFTVEFTYEDKEYVLNGEEYIKLTDLLNYLGLQGEVDRWEVSNNKLFTILRGDKYGISYDVEYIDEMEYLTPIDNPDGNILYMVSLKMFDTEEWLDVTINGITHHIIVTDDAYINGQAQDKITDSRVEQGGNETNFTATMPLATIFIDEDIVNTNSYKLLPPTFYTQEDYDNYVAENGQNPSWSVGDINYDIENNTGIIATYVYSGTKTGLKIDNTPLSDGYGQLYFDFSAGNLSYGSSLTDDLWSGPVVEYRFINAAERFNVTTQQYEKMDVIITYSNIHISLQNNLNSTNYRKLTKLEILDGNRIRLQMFASSDLGDSANDRAGLKLDINVKVVDKDNNLVDGSYYFPLVDADVQRANNVNFSKFYQATTTENNNYSEMFMLMSNYGQPTSTGAWEQKIWIPGGDYNKNQQASQDNNMPYLSIIDNVNGNLRIKPGAGYDSIPQGGYINPVPGTNTKRDNDFYTGFATLANNTAGGINFRYWGASGNKAKPAGSGTVLSYVLAGTQRINHKLDSSSDVGGTIYTTTTGNSDGSLSGGNLMGNNLINTPHQISTATGQNVTYTMTPKGGYKLKGVYIKSGDIDVLEQVNNNNGSTYSIPISSLTDKGKGIYTYTFTNIKEDNSIHVEWEKTDLTVTKNIDPVIETDHKFNFQIKLWENVNADTLWRVRARQYEGLLVKEDTINEDKPYYITYYESHSEEGEIESYTQVSEDEITDETNPYEEGWYEAAVYDNGYGTLIRYFPTTDTEPHIETDDEGNVINRKRYYIKETTQGNITKYYQHILGYNESTLLWESYDIKSNNSIDSIADIGLNNLDKELLDNYRFINKDNKLYYVPSWNAEEEAYTKYLMWITDPFTDKTILTVGNETIYPDGRPLTTEVHNNNKYFYVYDDGIENFSGKIINPKNNSDSEREINGKLYQTNFPTKLYKYEKDTYNPVYYDFVNNPDNLSLQTGYEKLVGENGVYIINLPAGESPDLSAFDGTNWDISLSRVGVIEDDFDMDAAFIEKGAIPSEGVNTYTFSLAPGETIDFEGCVPMGWNYSIKEIGLENTLWTLKTYSRNASMLNFDGDEDVTFVNKPPKELVITKKWVEPENQSIARPEDIFFTFKTYDEYIFDVSYNHSSKEAIKVEKIDDTWTYTFLVRYDEALESISEQACFGYNTTYDISTGTIINTYAPTSIEVIKTTEDGQDGTFEFVIQLEYVDAGPGYLLTNNDTKVEIMGSTNYILLPEHIFINGYNAITLDEPYETNGHKFDKVIIGDELQRLLEYIIEHCYFDTVNDTNFYYWPTYDITLYTDYERPYIEEEFIFGSVFSIYGEPGNRILDAWAKNLSVRKGHIDYWDYMDFSEYGLEHIGNGRYKFSITTENGEGRYKFEDMVLPGTWNRNYSIWEIVPDGWKLIDAENTDSKIEYKDNKVVRFTNKKVSSLTIRKEADVDTGEEFEFKAKIQDEVYTFKLKSGEEYVIPNIPYGYEYEIYEIDEDGNEISVGDIFNAKWKLKSATNQSGTLTENTTSVFTNEIKKGSIEVKKETIGNKNGEFKFKLKAMIDNIETIHSTIFQLTPETDYWVEYVYNGIRYAVIYMSKDHGHHEVNLRDGNILLIIGNEEDEWSGNVLDYILRLNDADYINETTIAEIIRNNLSKFAIYLNGEIIPFSELNISNIDEHVETISITETTVYYLSFDYSVKMEPTRPYDLSSQLGELNSDGYYEFTLKNGESLKLENIPYGVKYEIYEETQNGWRLISIDEVEKDKVQGIVEQEEITHTFLNEPLYSLTVSKEVTGNMGDKSKDFEFTIKVYSEPEVSGGFVGDNFVLATPFPIGNIPQWDGIQTSGYYEGDHLYYYYWAEGSDLWNYIVDLINSGQAVYDDNFGLNSGFVYRVNGTEYPIFFADGYSPLSFVEPPSVWLGTSYLDLTSYGGVSNGDGSYKFTLSHEESIIISDIPYGYQYEVYEKDYSEEGYTQYVNNELGKEISGIVNTDITADFVNDLTVAVPTKTYYNPSYMLYVLLLPLVYLIRRKIRNGSKTV